MDDKTTLRILGHYSPSAAADMRKHIDDRALLQDVAAAPDKLLIEPCGPDLERIDAVPHWKLARWFVGLGQVRGVTPEWASSYADRVPGEAGTRLNRAFKIYRASKLKWPGDLVLVAEFIRCLPELGLTMHSGSAARAEAVAAPATPEAPDSASAPAVVHRVRNRAHPLDGVIAEARRRAVRDDWLTVWGELIRMAECSDRPAPLMGYAPGDGLKVQSDAPEGFTDYTKDAFRQLWRRRNKG